MIKVATYKHVPIGLRTRNRPVFLDTTIRSLEASGNFKEVTILDDCSKDPIAVRHLNTNDIIKIRHEWPTSEMWLENVGCLEDIHQIKGVKNRYRVLTPDKRVGDCGGLFWCVNEMFKLYPYAQMILLIEADVVFCKDWYRLMLEAYKMKPDVGFVLGFDMWGSQTPDCVNLDVNPFDMTAQLLLVSRKLTAKSKAFRLTYDVDKKAGDTELKYACIAERMDYAKTSPSVCQHIGHHSSTRPGSPVRLAHNFKKPFVI